MAANFAAAVYVATSHAGNSAEGGGGVPVPTRENGHGPDEGAATSTAVDIEMPVAKLAETAGRFGGALADGLALGQR